MNRYFLLLAAGFFSLFSGWASQPLSAQRPNMTELSLSPDHTMLAPGGELWGNVRFYNTGIELSETRPEFIHTEPVYLGTPLYGQVRLGNGSRGAFTVVVDHPTGNDWSQCRIYIDRNQNGDLTDDGDGSWDSARTIENRPGGRFIVNVPLHASYNMAAGISPYHVLLIYTPMGTDMEMRLSYRRTTAQVGMLELGDNSHRVALVENNNNAIYNGRDMEGNPLWLMVDINRDGVFQPNEIFDARQAFLIGETTYGARIRLDGKMVILYEAEAVAAQTPQRVPGAPTPRVARPPLLAAGTSAPDFTAIAPDGSEVRLSDFRGQVVLLDFWATWCGPCIRSLPHLEVIHQRLKDRGVVVLGICVLDTAAGWEKWLEDPSVKTTFPKAFDPAGRGEGSIARELYSVSGIPTFYVIDSQGTIVDGFSGAARSPEDERIMDALRKAGIEL